MLRCLLSKTLAGGFGQAFREEGRLSRVAPAVMVASRHASSKIKVVYLNISAKRSCS